MWALLFFSLPGGGVVRRTDFNTRAWKPALAAAGLIPIPVDGGRYGYRGHTYAGVHASRLHALNAEQGGTNTSGRRQPL